MYFVYLLECTDGSLYAGITTDVERRFKEHTEGKKGARYTRARQPVRIAYVEQRPDRGLAQRREAELKRLSRAQKLALVAGGERDH